MSPARNKCTKNPTKSFSHGTLHSVNATTFRYIGREPLEAIPVNSRSERGKHLAPVDATTLGLNGKVTGEVGNVLPDGLDDA